MMRNLVLPIAISLAYAASVVGISIPVMELSVAAFPDSNGALMELKAMAITAASIWAITLSWSYGLLFAHRKAKEAGDRDTASGIQTIPKIVAWIFLAALAVAAIPYGIIVIPAGILAIPSVPFVVFIHPLSTLIFYGSTAVFAYASLRTRKSEVR